MSHICSLCRLALSRRTRNQTGRSAAALDRAGWQPVEKACGLYRFERKTVFNEIMRSF